MKTFFELFAGREDAYGIYRSEELRADGKKKGRGHTISKALTDEVRNDHLAGKHDSRLGVIPITPGNYVRWCAIDVDDYNIDHQKLVNSMIKLDLPGIVVRSKSGGAHIFFFMSEPVRASLAIQLLGRVKDLLKLGRVEIFPKQDTLIDDAIGNWIHLPYFGAEAPDSWALGLSGEVLTMGEFTQAANARLMSRSETAALLTKSEARDNLDEAPPCVQIMLRDGVEEGGRNNALFHIGVYFRKSDKENWREQLYIANQSQFDPPLPLPEIQKIAGSLGRKEYQYKCSDQPMASICDKATCLKRKFGVGPDKFDDYDEVDTSVIYKYDTIPVTFELRIGDRKVSITEDALTSRAGIKFRNRIFVETGLLMRPEKQTEYDKRLKNMEIVDADMPDGTSRDSIISREFRDWTLNRIKLTLTAAGIVNSNNPFYDTVTKMIIFQAKDLIEHLSRRGKVLDPIDVWKILREHGCLAGYKLKADNRTIDCWTYPVIEPWFELPNREKF